MGLPKLNSREVGFLISDNFYRLPNFFKYQLYIYSRILKFIEMCKLRLQMIDSSYVESRFKYSGEKYNGNPVQAVVYKEVRLGAPRIFKFLQRKYK
jgi:hypothetical protein